MSPRLVITSCSFVTLNVFTTQKRENIRNIIRKLCFHSYKNNTPNNKNNPCYRGFAVNCEVNHFKVILLLVLAVSRIADGFTYCVLQGTDLSPVTH